MHYQEKLDQIFANGDHWKHRTLRTVFDVGSHEHAQTPKKEKLEILRKCVKNDLNLHGLIDDYMTFYEKQNPEANRSIRFATIDLLTQALNEKNNEHG